MARLVSPIYNQAGQSCSFEFWYQIYGNETGKINIYIKSSLSDSLIKSIGNDFTKEWKQMRVQLPTCAKQFQVVIEGVRGSDDSVIAIDDLRFADCEYKKPTQQCNAADQFKCNSNHCVSNLAVCDLSNDCCDGSDEAQSTCANFYRCNFEDDLCGFRNLNETVFTWSRTRSDSMLSFDKPLLDHSLQSSRVSFLNLLGFVRSHEITFCSQIHLRDTI